MVCRLSLIFLCIFAIQGLNGQVPVPCNQKINQLRLELSGLARRAGYCISVSASAISRDISIQRYGIKTALIELRNKANLVVGPNAQLCRNKLNTDLAPVNEQSLNVCYNNAQLNLLNQRVNQINNLKNTANVICRNCLEESTCVDAEIEKTREEGQNLQQGTCSDASVVQEQSAQCALDAANGQLETIKTASDNFDTCIQGA